MGDICARFDGGKWRTPRGGSVGWQLPGGNNPFSGNISDYVTTAVETGAGTGNVAIVSADKSIFLPAGGTRSTTGSMIQEGTAGYYWSSTALSTNNGTYYNQGGLGGSVLSFSANSLVENTITNYIFGYNIRCVPKDPPIVVPNWPSEPEIAGGRSDVLYYKNDGTLEVGRWGRDVSEVSKLAFFKFGSVVGMTTAETIGFNPTQNSYTAQNAPMFNNGSPGDWDTSNIYALTNVSDPRYHKMENIAVGKGDPCQLAGLKTSDFTGKSAAEIAQMIAANDAARAAVGVPKWYLPSPTDNIHFMGGSYSGVGWSGYAISRSSFTSTTESGNVSTTWFPQGTKNYSLPVAGVIRYSGGSGYENLNVEGYYWTAYAGNAQPLMMSFGPHRTNVASGDPEQFGIGTTIRCISNPTVPPLP
jgi:hypothetical protein